MTSSEPIRPSDVVEAGHRNSAERGDRELIERALRSPDPAVRLVALGALLRVGRLDADRLATSATDPASNVRRRVAELAPRISDPGGTEVVLRQLLDDEPEIAEVAAFALGEVGSSSGVRLASTSIAALEHMVRNHDDALCREAAVAALGALHTGLETILVACRDKATVRRRAVIALAPFDGPEVEAALEVARSDRDWQVRQAAEDLSDGSDSS